MRAFGATAVLLGIAVAAFAQTGPGEASAMDITALPPIDVTSSSTMAFEWEITETTSPPFEYRIGLLAGVSTQNFWVYYGVEPTAWNAYVLGPTKPALFALDSSAALVPELSSLTAPEPTLNTERWGVQINLRDSLRWSDGTPITAHDIVFTFESVRKLNLGGGWSEGFPEVIESVLAISDYDLRIEFGERPSLSVWPFGVGLAPVMPRHVWSEVVDNAVEASDLYAAAGNVDVSGGPLQIVSFGVSEVQAVANPGYPAGPFGSVRFAIYESEEAAAEALKGNEIDIILSPKGLKPSTAKALATQPGIAVESSPANAVGYLGFNLSRQPMVAPGFREAVALLVDRDAAVAKASPGSQAAYTLLPPSNETWQEQKRSQGLVDLYTGSLEERMSRALETLKAEGYSWATQPSVQDGAMVGGVGLKIKGATPAPLTILTSGDLYDPARPEYAAIVEAAIELLGFDVRPVITDFDSVIDLAFTPQDNGQRQYDMYLLGWTLGNPALPDFYRLLFAENASANSTGFTSEDFAVAMSAYQGAFHHDEALEALWNMEETIALELPYLVLYHPQIIEAYRTDRIRFELSSVLGGMQGRGGGFADLTPVS